MSLAETMAEMKATHERVVASYEQRSSELCAEMALELHKNRVAECNGVSDDEFWNSETITISKLRSIYVELRWFSQLGENGDISHILRRASDPQFDNDTLGCHYREDVTALGAAMCRLATEVSRLTPEPEDLEDGDEETD